MTGVIKTEETIIKNGLKRRWTNKAIKKWIEKANVWTVSKRYG